MTEEEITYYTAQALILILVLSMPTIVVAAVTGLLVGLFQAVTQLQEQTIQFAIKLIAVSITIAVTARWTGIQLYNYTLSIFDSIPLVPV